MKQISDRCHLYHPELGYQTFKSVEK